MTSEGWTVNGHHYTHCLSVRMGRPLETFHRDGIKLTEREWRRLMAQDREAAATQANKE